MSQLRTSEEGITFVVHKVEPETQALPTWKTRDGISRLLATANESEPVPILSCSGYNSDCVADVLQHPLIYAVHLAFSQHRPLVLSPDMIWIAIIQGLSQHVKINAEGLRHKFVQHQGRLDIAITRMDILLGSPENAWDSVISDLSKALRGHLGQIYDPLVSNFSTTGDLERTVCEIALLDVFQPYFTFSVRCICGIPSITLEGRPGDWQLLASKLDALEGYGLDWWLRDLRHIVGQFERASRGDVETVFWQDIYKEMQAYGAHVINGWIVRLIPYLKNYISGDFTIKNPLIGKPIIEGPPAPREDSGMFFAREDDVQSSQLPSGISMVPVNLRAQDGSRITVMNVFGGFVGVEQIGNTMQIRPKLGWAIMEAPDREKVLLDLPPGAIVKEPLAPALYTENIRRLLDDDYRACVTDDLLRFYKECDGISFKGQKAKAASFLGISIGAGKTDAIACIRPLREVTVVAPPNLKSGSKLPYHDEPHHTESKDSRWIHIADFADGTQVAMQMSSTREFPMDSEMDAGRMERVRAWGAQPELFRVSHINPATGAGDVIATSFSEFVRAFIASEGNTSCIKELKSKGSVSKLR